MRATGRTARGVLVAAALLLAGCSGDGDDKPVTLPSATVSTASSEPSTTPTTSAPSEASPPTTEIVLPEAQFEAIETLVQDFFAALNEAQSSGDFSALDSLYLPGCVRCGEMRAEVVKRLENGQAVEGGQWIVIDTTSDALSDGSEGGFSALAYRTSASILASDGSTIATEPQSPALLFNAVVIASGDWSISDLGYREA